jgi:hypothetical protein
VSRDKVVGNQCVVGMVAILLYFLATIGVVWYANRRSQGSHVFLAPWAAKGYSRHIFREILNRIYFPQPFGRDSTKNNSGSVVESLPNGS